MKRVPQILCALLATCALFWFFPLFHIVRVETASERMHNASFNAAKFADAFWKKKLRPSLDSAPGAASVLKALQEDPKTACEKFGRKVGLSRTRIIMLQGTGRIVTVDKKGVGVALDSDSGMPDIILQSGLLFGNTVRDATGLIDPSSFADSRHFNEVSVELNRIIESRVMPELKSATGLFDQNIKFVGCAAVSDSQRFDLPLTVIPLDVRTPLNNERPLLSDGPHAR